MIIVGLIVTYLLNKFEIISVYIPHEYRKYCLKGYLTKEEKEKQQLDLEIRKIKALEKIGNSLEALTIWFEEIDKTEWSERVQYYLAEFHKFNKPEKDNTING